MIKRLIHTVFYFCFSLISAIANDLPFEYFGLDDGLSNSTVNVFYKSKSDLIWIGTDRGVDLFTGNAFIPLDHFMVDSVHVVKTSITAIAELQANQLWVGTWGDGLFSVDIESGKYQHFRADEFAEQNTVTDNYINCLHTQDDELWIGTIFGLSQTKGNGQFTHYAFKEVLTKGIPDIRAITPKYEHLLSIFTNNGEILELNTQTGTYSKVGEINTPISSISSIKRDKQGLYWIGTEFKGLLLLDENYKQIKIPDSLIKTLGPSHISDICIHPEGDILVSSDGGGLFIINHQTYEWQNLTHSLYNSNSIFSNQLQSLMFDSDGILWVGYYKDGFSKTVYKGDGISHFHKTGTKKGMLPNKNVNCFTEDKDGNIWVGTEGGIAIMNADLKPVKSTRLHKAVKETFKGHPVTALQNNKQKDEVYIGTYNNGFSIANLKTNKITNFNKNNSQLKSNFVRDIKDVNDTLTYIATIDGGLYSFDGTNFKLIKIYYQNNFELKDFLHINIIDENNLWLSCTGKGVMCINTSNASGDLFNEVIASICYSSYTTSDSSVYITTNKGLFKYNKELNDFIALKGTDPSSEYYGIIEDEEGALWISSSTGLLKYNPTEDILKGIVSINIQNREFIPCAFLKLSDGRFLFGGTNGFNIIEPHNYKNHTGKPSVFLSDFKVYNQQVKPGVSNKSDVELSRQINFVDEIHIPANINLFSIDINTINYLNYNHNKVAYTIKNGNNESEIMYTTNEVGFLNLNPGTYTLSLYPINQFTNKALLTAGRELTVHKAAPWWKSYWIYSLAFTLITITILTLHKLKVRDYERTKHLLERTVSDKTATLLSQKDALLNQRDELKKMLTENHKLESFKESVISMIVHDLKNPLNGIIGLSSLNDSQYIDHINSASRQMLYLVENILDVRRYETHSLKLFYQICDIRQLINEAIDDVSFLLKDSDIEIKNLITPTQINVDKDIVRRVFINLLTNAIKYSPIEGVIHLRSETIDAKQEKTLLLSVQDQGQGVPSKYKDSIFDLYQQVETKKSGQTNSNGLGLSFCKIAVEEHNGTIWVESEKGEGSKFLIQLPIENA